MRELVPIGHVSVEDLPTVAVGVPDPMATVAVLVALGLWVPDATGWRIMGRPEWLDLVP